MPKRPLEGIRIIDSTYVFAMPYACGILTDLGAEVIKVEGIQHPDRAASVGGSPDGNAGDDPWNRAPAFNQLNRAKRSLTLDLSREEGRQAFKDLVKVSDIVVENYTPRVMRRWEMDYPNLIKLKPDIIMLSNTGYGHGDGPYSMYPGQATTMEAIHGLCWITGYNNDIPSKAGASYVDFLACWTGLFAVANALRYRNRTSKGQWIDLAMYQLGCYWTSEYIMDYQVNGRLNGRLGNRHPWKAPQGCYPCKEENNWCTLSVGDDDEWVALCNEMGRPELIDDPRFKTVLGRQQNHDVLDDIISEWSHELDKFDMQERLQAAGVPAGAVHDFKDTNLSKHYWSRGFLERVTWPEHRRDIGTRVLMGRPWQLNKTPLRIQEPVHTLGEDNRYVLQDLLHYSDETVAKLEETQIIGDKPIAGARRQPYVPPTPGAGQSTRTARLTTSNGYLDPNYKELLGLP
ncbi:MAG: CoA transferase [Chloroflexi bacterium]|nr:CoA transferase [Chloroflexota bacterium]